MNEVRAAPGPAIDIRGLAKTYSTGLFRRVRRIALRDLTLSVAREEIFGYLGPNGAGKTTTLKIIMGLTYPDAGTVAILGRPLGDRAWRYRAGYVPEHPYLYDYLTPREYLDYAGRLCGMRRRERAERSRELLDRLGLLSLRDVPLRRFSKGLLQRLALAQALVNDPDLIFMDEPMSGLDPLGRRLVRDLIIELRQRGKTILFSTHILSDAESLCDRVGLLRDGELVRVGRVNEILQLDVSHMEVLVSGLASPEALPVPIRSAHALGERWRLEVKESAVGATVRAVEEQGGRILSVQPIRQSLEDYFVKEVAGAPAGAWPLAD